MPASTTQLIRELRARTSAGVMDCKKALEESKGDVDKAESFLKEKGIASAAKKAGRETDQGLIDTYIHSGGRIGAMIEINCETDFVAKTDDFSDLGHNFAMQLAATDPMAIVRESIPEDVIAREKDIYTEQAKAEGKPDNIIEKMVEGRLNKFYQENCLLEQAYIKDPDKKVKDLLTELIATLGENISIKRFVRFAIGETHSTNGQV